MQLRIEITTTAYDALGKITTSVTTATEASLGDNLRLLRGDLARRHTYGDLITTNVDQIVAGLEGLS